MLKGEKKGRGVKYLSKPGVADADIAGSEDFGEIISQYLNSGEWETDCGEALVNKRSCYVIKYRRVLQNQRHHVFFFNMGKTLL